MTELPTVLLSDKQKEILYALIKNKDKVRFQPTIVGITPKKLEEFGLRRTTTSDNLPFLLENQMIHLVYLNEHTGKRSWKYYDITPQGILNLLKSIKLEEKLWMTIPYEFERFFPLISSHWKKLTGIVGKTLPIILKISVGQIEMNLYKSLTNKKSSQLQTSSESCELDYTDFSFKLKTPQKLTIFNKNKLENNLVTNNHLLVQDRIKKIFTFLFYFNLLNKKHTIEKARIYYLESIEPIKIENIKKDFKPMVKLGNYKEDKILNIINNDEDLLLLFKNMLSEVIPKIQTPTSIKILKKSLKK